jgi:predicted dienelactone hydrolase
MKLKLFRLAILTFLPICHAAFAQVGMSQLQIGDMPVTMVYPTQAISAPITRGPFALNVALNASPLTKSQRLVVLSHGTGGSALADHALAATLARAGFVVAQPLHTGDNSQDSSKAGPTAFKTRPHEVTQVIDALAKHPLWSGVLRLDKVGVHGMSAGGVTGLALAGAQWRTLNLVQHCNRVQEADAGFCFQGAASGKAREERAASFDRAKNVPEVFLPDAIKSWHGGLSPSSVKREVRPDQRIASVSLSVPVAAIFSAESLARIQIPVALITAKNDGVLVPRFHSDHVLANCRNCQLLVELTAGHFDLLAPWPEPVAKDVASAQVRGGMPTSGFDARLRDSAFAKVAEFHLKHLGSAIQLNP